MLKSIFLSLLFSIQGLASTHHVHGEKTQKVEIYPHEMINCELSQESPVSHVFKIAKGNYLNCHQVKNFESILLNIKEIQAEAPPVALYINKSYPNASFDMGKIIRIPLELSFSGKWGNIYSGSYMAADTVLAHEYGHAVFAQKMKGHKFYAPIQEMSLKASELELTIQELYSKGNPSNLVKFYTKQLHALNDKRLNDKELKKVRKFIGPYNELYADLVAAFSLNRKNAMVDALYYDEMSDQAYETIQARNFSENSLDMTGSYMHQEHGMFAPTRQFIGKNLWTKDKLEQKKVLDTLFDTIASEISYLIEYDVKYLAPTTLNKKLIEALKQKLIDQE